MKLALVLLALLAALVAVHGETKGTTTTTVVGAASSPARASPVSVSTITTTSGTTTATLPNVTSGVSISSTGATGSFVGQPTIKGDGGGTVTIGTTTAGGTTGTATASPATIVGAAGGATSPSVALASTSPAASGGAVVTVVSASPAISGAASPAASGAASPAASGAASPAASGAASPAASGAASPAASGAASPAASGAASPAASGAASPAASGAASPAASGAASPAASGAASPAASLAASPAASPTGAIFGSPSPSVVASAAGLFPTMPTYGEENFQFTCPNATVESMVEVSFEPLLIGIDAVSSIKFAGCPSLMYVATRAGQIFEVTINNATSAVEQVRLILDLSSEIVTPSSQAGAAGAGASASSSSSAGSNSTSGSASASSNAADQPGLLGMAFPPDFADTGLFYLYFSARSSAGGAGGAGAAGGAGGAGTTAGGAGTASGAGGAGGAGGAVCGDESSMLDHVNRLAEYRLDSTSGIANFSRTLLEVRWPFANGNGDNSLEFAPNSMLLFLGVGDGGSSYDPFENAQNPDILLGKIHVFDLSSLSSSASCNTSVLRLSELASNCSDIAAAITTFATGMHVPAGFEFLNPSAELEGSSCPSGANAGGANATAGGANATADGANATEGGANATTSSMNLTLSDLAPRLIAPDRGQGMYDEINIMEEIGANYGWDIIEGWTCINQSLELCPDVTSELLSSNASLAGGANATANITAGGANETASANATTAEGANQTTSANATASTMGVLPAAVIPHNCRRLYNPQAILGGRLYQGSTLDPMLQGAYIFGATTSLQNGNETLPTGNGALYFMRPESFSGNAMVDLTMCPAAADETAGAGEQNASMAGNATMNANNATSPSNASLGDVTVTGSGVNMSFIPNSRLEVFPVTINYHFFPAQHFFTAMGADASRTQLFVGVSSMASAAGGIGGVFRLIPFNEGTQNPAVISATNLQPGQIVFSAANANANATTSA